MPILFSTLQLTFKVIITLLHLLNQLKFNVFNFVTISTFSKKMFCHTTSVFTSYNITLTYSEPRLKSAESTYCSILLFVMSWGSWINELLPISVLTLSQYSFSEITTNLEPLSWTLTQQICQVLISLRASLSFFCDVMKYFGVKILRMGNTLLNFLYKCF